MIISWIPQLSPKPWPRDKNTYKICIVFLSRKIISLKARNPIQQILFLFYSIPLVYTLLFINTTKQHPLWHKPRFPLSWNPPPPPLSLQSDSLVAVSRALKCFFPVTSDELSISTSLELNIISGPSKQENFNKTSDTYSAQEVNIQPSPIKYWVPKMMMIRL